MALQPSKVINCKLTCSNLLTILYQSFHTKYRGPPSYATVVPLDRNSHITEIRLRQVIETYRSTDVVFRVSFLIGVISTGVTSETSLDIPPAVYKLLESLGTSWVEPLDTDGVDEIPPSAPHVTAGQYLLQFFRIYDDVQGAFIDGIIPKPHS